MERTSLPEETLRLQFGTAANTIGAQLYAIEKLNDGNPGLHRSDGTPRMLAFETKGRIHRKTSSTQAVNREAPQPDPQLWSGGVQVYDQAPPAPVSSSFLPSTAYWNWDDFTDKNLVEIDEFRPYMPLHNFYEGQTTARDGSISLPTMDGIEDRLRGVLEECDNLRFIQNIVDMDSAWAGLSLEVLTYLNEECPSAVVATFGNDWNYPLSDQSDSNLYSAGIESRDRSKIEARRRINLAASVASFIEISGVFIPVALSSSSRRYKMAASTHELSNAASFAATAIEIALSAFRSSGSSTIYGLLEGIVPSMKIVELAARFPLTENPLAIVDEATALTEAEQLKWTQHSLLPQWERRSARGFGSLNVAAVSAPPRFRRVHFRGEFDEHASILQNAMQRFQPNNSVVEWTPDAVYVDHNDSIDAMDAASQIALSSGVGQFLGCLTAPMSRGDKRILYEFTQAGMNVDALEDFQATLRAYSDAYPKADVAQRDPWDDDDDQDEQDQ